MRDFQARKKNSSWRYWIITLCLFILLLIMLRGVWDLFKKNQLAREHYQEAEHRLTDLEQEKKTLTATLANLKTERGIEAEIRKNFSVAKEGEKVITIIDNQQAIATTSPKNNNSIWSWFFNIFK